MAALTTPTARIIGATAFRALDESREIALRSDGAILGRETGRKRWRIAGAWDICSPCRGQVRARLGAGFTEHQLDDEGDTIR